MPAEKRVSKINARCHESHLPREKITPSRGPEQGGQNSVCLVPLCANFIGFEFYDHLTEIRLIKTILGAN